MVLALVAVLLLGPGLRWVRTSLYPLRYEELVFERAEEYGVDPFFAYAVIRTESGFDPLAESAAGARGLMQMTEDTFEWLRPKVVLLDETLTFDDLYKPEVSIRFGVYFLSLCLQRYQGDISTAAAAYHSGWGTVDELLLNEKYSPNGVYLSEFPYKQMHHYVNKVEGAYDMYRMLYD